MIPYRIIRTVPAQTSVEVEQWWEIAAALHPGWSMITLRDPLDPADFPITSPHWSRCQNGAQLAGLVRLEALFRTGGIYIDSDVELYRSLAPLLHGEGFAGWEDASVVPDAVLGSIAGHSGIYACIELAIERLRSDSTDWRTGNGAWATGPGVTTTLLPGRDDMLLLPPASFYPVHYSDKERTPTRAHVPAPYTFGIHHWAASWLS